MTREELIKELEALGYVEETFDALSDFNINTYDVYPIGAVSVKTHSRDYKIIHHNNEFRIVKRLNVFCQSDVINRFSDDEIDISSLLVLYK